MASFSSLTVVGNLTRDVQVKYLPTGTAVANGGVAINRKYKDKDKTVFLEFAAFGKLAEIMGEYCHKGQSVLLSGELDEDQWEDKETGHKRSKLKLLANVMQMLSKRDGAASRQESEPESHPEHLPEEVPSEPVGTSAFAGDLPF